MARERRPLFLTAVALIFTASLTQAQPVVLQIRPHVGDTISVRLNQTVDMTGTTVRGTTTSGRMTTMTEVFSRAIVQSASGEYLMVLAVTDSIRMSTARGGRPGAPKRVRGREGSMKLKLSTDGGAEVIDSDASEELRAIFGQMPAMLSKKPVSVGGKWTREMRIPIAGEAGAMGLVRATFRLDSLGKNGDIAYISMRGTLSHDHRDGSNSELDGSMTGSLQLDRRLAWITESRAEIDVTTMFRAPAGVADTMRVRTRVTQLLKAAPAR
jgi:hypothetical protein